MSEVSKNISELLSGTYGKAIVVGGTVYVIKAPSIKVIMRATQYLSKVDLPENGTVRELMKVAPANLENIVKGLSWWLVMSRIIKKELKASNGRCFQVLKKNNCKRILSLLS